MQDLILPELWLPQLATTSSLHGGVPTTDDWVSEVKLDGFRLMARKCFDRVDLFTRRGFRWTDKFPGIVADVRRLPVKEAWLDGELVVMKPDGRSCFGSLQEAVARKDQAAVSFYLFDAPFLDGDIRSEPLELRKRLLAELLQGAGEKLAYVDYIRGSGPDFYEAACAHGLEGIVSKKADSPYCQGKRTRTWLKTRSTTYRQNAAWRWWMVGGRKVA